MSLNLRVDRIVGRAGPQRALLFSCNGMYNGSGLAYLLGLSGRLRYRGQVLSDVVCVERVSWQQSDRPELRRDAPFALDLAVPLSNTAIAFVEDNHGQSDVALQLEFHAQHQAATTMDPQGTVIARNVSRQQGIISCYPIPRSSCALRR